MKITLGVANMVPYFLRNANGFRVTPGSYSQAIKIRKAGGTLSSATNTATSLGDGVFTILLTAAECDTPGELIVVAGQSSYYGEAVFEVVAHEPTPHYVTVEQYHTAGWQIPIRLTLPDGSPARNAVAGGGVTMASAINGSGFASIAPVQLAEFGSDSNGWYHFDSASSAATHLCGIKGQRIVNVASVANPLARGSVVINVI